MPSVSGLIPPGVQVVANDAYTCPACTRSADLCYTLYQGACWLAQDQIPLAVREKRLPGADGLASRNRSLSTVEQTSLFSRERRGASSLYGSFRARSTMTTIEERHDHPSSPSALLNLLCSGWISRAIQVAAQLGIAELLTDGPKSATELAQSTGTHAPSLLRLLGALASIGVFAEEHPGSFAQTPLSSWLRRDTPGSIHQLALLLAEHYKSREWEDLVYSVQTGEPAFDHIYGMTIWQYFAANPAAGKLFHQAMAKRAEPINAAVIQQYDFSAIQTIVDVGGGLGGLLATILKAFPAMTGALFDFPSVLEAARAHLADAGVLDRCELVPGDFFKAVPEGADAYLLMAILHNWDDAHCLTLLRNCRQAMRAGSKLLVIERVAEPGQEQSVFGVFLDLQMLLEQRGHQRTNAEVAQLMASSGIRLARVTPIAAGRLLEGVAIPASGGH
jgi:hypothetical protein